MANMKVALIVLLGISCLVSSSIYEGYKVFRMWPKTEQQIKLLEQLEDVDGYDFWADINRVNLPVDVLVEPERQDQFVETVNDAGMEVSTFIEDIAEYMKRQKVESLQQTGNMTWTAYYTLEDIYLWFDELAVAYPNQVTVEIAGSSYEDREIRGVKISFGTGRKTVMFEGGIHAREWISPATMTYMIHELLTSNDTAFRNVADGFDWYIFPVTNPDGYVYTHTTDRVWRKTRTVYPGTCRGADPNRNFDVYWGQIGSSANCSSNTYRGPNPFSEKSTNSFSQYITNLAPNMVAYISFHSYSQMLMVPYGHTTEQLDNYNETVAIGRVAIEALASRYGTRYTVGNIAETLTTTSGVSIDWVKQKFQIPLVYVYELRDLGRFGFLLPPDQIIPNSEEVVDSIVAMFEEADKLGIISLHP